MEVGNQTVIEDLPVSIRSYFAGKNAGDLDAAISGFSRSAVVRDEGHRHVGLAAIRAWMEDTTAKSNEKTEVTGVTMDGAEVEVVARLSGVFPGSPITLRFFFTLGDQLIAELRIAS